jgi:hypothetical protein
MAEKMGEVGTGPQTEYLDASLLCSSHLVLTPPSTSLIFPAATIQQMPHLEEHLHPNNSSFHPLSFLLCSPNLSEMPPLNQQVPISPHPPISTSEMQFMISRLMSQWGGIMEQSFCISATAGTDRNSHFLNTPTIATSDTPTALPHPYISSLTPLPSSLHPHCLAKDHLCLWHPTQSCAPLDHNGTALPLSEADLNQILTVIRYSFASSTKETYGSGLLAYHVFCDARSIPEDQQGPASSLLLLSFIASCTGLYSGKTLENYFYGVQAWHLLHGLAWLGDSAQITSALTGSAHLAPPPSKHPKRHPFTINILRDICSVLDLSSPLDAAVYACLVTSFFTLACLGELMVHSLKAFNPSLHVKVSESLFFTFLVLKCLPLERICTLQLRLEMLILNGNWKITCG